MSDNEKRASELLDESDRDGRRYFFELLDTRKCVALITSELQAAEERGRRRGVEERDNALKAAHEYCLYMFRREWLENPVHRNTFAGHIFAILDVALTAIGSDRPVGGSLVVGKALADLAGQECENGIAAVGETCIASAQDPANTGEPDYRFQHWCGPCIASTLIAEGSDEATVALAPRDSAPQPARMDAPGGPLCWCGRPSARESGWCGSCQSGDEVLP